MRSQKGKDCSETWKVIMLLSSASLRPLANAQGKSSLS